MNECDKRARVLSGRVPGLGTLQEMANYLDWFLPPPDRLWGCTTSRGSRAALELEGPIGRPSACCFQVGASLRVAECVFLGIQSCLEGSRAATPRIGRVLGAEGEERTGCRLANSTVPAQVCKNPNVSSGDSRGYCETSKPIIIFLSLRKIKTVQHFLCGWFIKSFYQCR